MVSSAIDQDFLAHLVANHHSLYLAVRLQIDGKEYEMVGIRKRCIEKDKMLYFDLLKPGSSPEDSTVDLAAQECIRDAFERLARSGERFITGLRREWDGLPRVWSL